MTKACEQCLQPLRVRHRNAPDVEEVNGRADRRQRCVLLEIEAGEKNLVRDAVRRVCEVGSVEIEVDEINHAGKSGYGYSTTER